MRHSAVLLSRFLPCDTVCLFSVFIRCGAVRFCKTCKSRTAPYSHRSKLVNFKLNTLDQRCGSVRILSFDHLTEWCGAVWCGFAKGNFMQCGVNCVRRWKVGNNMRFLFSRKHRFGNSLDFMHATTGTRSPYYSNVSDAPRFSDSISSFL